MHWPMIGSCQDKANTQALSVRPHEPARRAQAVRPQRSRSSAARFAAVMCRAGNLLSLGSALPGIAEDSPVQILTKEPRIPFMDPNSHEALLRRREAATLTWRGPALMLFARAACAVGAQAVVAAVFALRASPTPWHDAEPWLPVYGTLIDAGCLALLWRLTRREGIRLFDLVGFERTRLVRDTLLGFALIPASLVFILRWHLCGRLAFVRNAHAAVPLWAPAIAGRSLWRAGVAVHLGADRADDL